MLFDKCGDDMKFKQLTVRFLTVVFVITVILPINTYAASEPANPDVLPGAESHTYKVVGDIALRLHVFDQSPKASETRPAIVFFFGGGLMRGKITHFQGQAKALSALGMVAVLADYRVKLRHNTGPIEAISDAKDAVRWVRAHAEKLNIDAQRVVAAGGSSGGYLAAATATVADQAVSNITSEFSSKPNAVVLFNPALANKHPRVNKALSPTRQLFDASVPTFIVHGKEDKIVPYSSAVDYCDTVISLEGYCELHSYEKAGHGFFNRGRNGNKGYDDTLSELITFLKKFGYIK